MKRKSLCTFVGCGGWGPSLLVSVLGVFPGCPVFSPLFAHPILLMVALPSSTAHLQAAVALGAGFLCFCLWGKGLLPVSHVIILVLNETLISCFDGEEGVVVAQAVAAFNQSTNKFPHASCVKHTHVASQPAGWIAFTVQLQHQVVCEGEIYCD
jgi:hypothetical protein